MKISTLKYLGVLTLPLLAYISFTSRGWITYAPILEAFLLVPLVELLIKPDPENLDETEEHLRNKNMIYDLMLYIMVPVQFLLLYIFLSTVNEPGLLPYERLGRLTAMGLLCGVIGINVAHELGHRNKPFERILAKSLLMTSLYMHFYIEHNRGHHRNVATPHDPSSARYGENLYFFWVRSVCRSYISAWRLEKERLKKKSLGFVHFRNEMLRFQVIQLALVMGIYFYFGATTVLYFIGASVMGFLLLETVNYIEHYGLVRRPTDNGFERVQPSHSWNSNHVMGRLMLFELSRHSDHHFNASRKYQILRNMDDSPQMPTGYPGMMILSIFPPFWFAVMNPKIKPNNALS
jgi:alkane 1-monooxygenase